MPLKRGHPKKTINSNIRTLVREGRSQRQAIAIAFTQVNKIRKKRGKK